MAIVVAGTKRGHSKKKLKVKYDSKGKKCSGGKHNKARITGMAAVSATREYPSMFIKELDKGFVLEDCKVVFIVDHCPAHT